MESLSDRELLELAAKAVGYDVWRGRGHQEDMLFMRLNKPDPSGKCSGREWNPLTDDGDALRLAAKLELEIQVFHGYGEVWADSVDGSVRAVVDMTSDRSSDYRNAIVRAAAEIGAAMP